VIPVLQGLSRVRRQSWSVRVLVLVARSFPVRKLSRSITFSARARYARVTGHVRFCSVVSGECNEFLVGVKGFYCLLFVDGHSDSFSLGDT
jgi:hypothetical protein